MKLARALAVGALLLGSTTLANATIPLVLTGPIQGNTVGPQSTSDPCIMAGTACHQAGVTPAMGFNNFTSGGNITSFNAWSTNAGAGTDNGANVPDGVQGIPYTVGQLDAVMNNKAFNVAIDVNTSAGGETLQSFEVLDTTTQQVLYSFTGPALIGNIANNGNGFADWTLGTINLTGLPATDGILFNVQYNNASDGAESFFLVPSVSAVPEPSTWGMLLLGFVGLAFAFRKRRSVIALA